MIFALYINNSLKMITKDAGAFAAACKRFPALRFNVRTETHGETSPLRAHFENLLATRG